MSAAHVYPYTLCAGRKLFRHSLLSVDKTAQKQYHTMMSRRRKAVTFPALNAFAVLQDRITHNSLDKVFIPRLRAQGAQVRCQNHVRWLHKALCSK